MAVYTSNITWKFLGNRLVEAYIRGNARAKDTERLEMGIFFGDLP
jgi:hypothetical protein